MNFQILYGAYSMLSKSVMAVGVRQKQRAVLEAAEIRILCLISNMQTIHFDYCRVRKVVKITRPDPIENVSPLNRVLVKAYHFIISQPVGCHSMFMKVALGWLAFLLCI
jgi:hypothetical protein